MREENWDIKAKEQGRQAYKSGKNIADNPYCRDKETEYWLYRFWQQGFLDAEGFARDQRLALLW